MSARTVSLRLTPDTRKALRNFRYFLAVKTGTRVTTDAALRLLLVVAREAKKEGLLDRVIQRVLGVRAEVVSA